MLHTVYVVLEWSGDTYISSRSVSLPLPPASQNVHTLNLILFVFIYFFLYSFGLTMEKILRMLDTSEVLDYLYLPQNIITAL